MNLIPKRINWPLVLFFCFTAGLAATLWGYNYSAGNAEEQLPFIFRALDPTYLAKDFFTNTAELFGPRTLFSEFIAFFARSFPLSTVLFSFTLIANISIAYLSSLTSRFFFPHSNFGALLSAAGVLTLKTFWLGYSNIVFRTFLEPEHLALPFLLLGFYLILKSKPIPASLSFGVAALFHLLMGLETGWLMLGASSLLFLFKVIRKEISLKSGKNLGIGLLILSGFSILLLVPYLSQPTISSSQFIQLVAYVRHPHHYLPSTFELWQYGQAAVYLFGFGILFWIGKKRSENLRKFNSLLLLVGGIILLFCVGGYLFVEVWPSRIWTAAQMFRLPYLTKWFSIVLMTGWTGSVIDEPKNEESRLLGFSSGIGLITPVSIAWIAAASWARRMLLPRLKIPSWLLHDSVILVITTLSILVYKPELRTWCLFTIFFLVIWMMDFFHWRRASVLIISLVPLFVSILFLLFRFTLTPPDFLKYEIPVFSLIKTSGEPAEMAKFARENTPKNAVFLTLPKYGEFRYAAERAIVVDIVAFPFQDKAMVDWYERMADCYGMSALLGFNALPELNHRFHSITDSQLRYLAKKYGVDYAILYKDTVTDFPVLHETETLKMIRVTLE
ncbi:MAG: hypothetical protein NTZ74_03885 [Chloroflexi bacterium]|nr:hypothetical protein [Chloroflexota bacterium]